MPLGLGDFFFSGDDPLHPDADNYDDDPSNDDPGSDDPGSDDPGSDDEQQPGTARSPDRWRSATRRWPSR